MKRNYPKEYMLSLLKMTKLSTLEIAKRTGYSHTTVERYEKKVRSPIQRFYSKYKDIREVDILPQQLIYLREELKLSFKEIGLKIHLSPNRTYSLYKKSKALLVEEDKWNEEHQQLQSV